MRYFPECLSGLWRPNDFSPVRHKTHMNKLLVIYQYLGSCDLEPRAKSQSIGVGAKMSNMTGS